MDELFHRRHRQHYFFILLCNLSNGRTVPSTRQQREGEEERNGNRPAAQ